MSLRRTLSFLLLVGACLGPVQAQEQSSHVVMMSFDGLRHDYVQDFLAAGGELPNFQRLFEEGASADSLIPSYPSSTFPNHYTLVTGLYPGHHGLVNNRFFSRRLDLEYSMGNRDRVEDARFYGGVPLWQYVQRHGFKAASYFWVGSEAPVAGSLPDYYFTFDDSHPDEQRVRTTLSWLALPDAERPRFISVYFSFLDHAGHEFGPESAEVRDSLPRADALLGAMMDGLEASGLDVHLMVVSDHGMYPISGEDKVISVAALHLPDNAKAVTSSTLVQLYVDDDAVLADVRAALQAQASARHFEVYLKEETPEHWHYREHPDTGELLLAAMPGYIFSERPVKGTIGVHGYDPVVQEMHAVFHVWGPRVRPGVRVPAFENVHVFPLVTHLLGLPEAKDIDGELTPLLPLLRD